MARIESPTHPAPFTVGDRIRAARGTGVVTRVEWGAYHQWGQPGWDIVYHLDASPKLARVTVDGAGLVPEDAACPNCGSPDVKFHVRQRDCRTCFPLGVVYPVGTDIDRDDHRHWSCAKGHRWADPR